MVGIGHKQKSRSPKEVQVLREFFLSGIQILIFYQITEYSFHAKSFPQIYGIIDPLIHADAGRRETIYTLITVKIDL